MTTPVTVITDASAGLGAEFARQFAGRGQKPVLVARRKDRIAATEFDDFAGFGKDIPKAFIAEAAPVVRAGIRGLERNQAVVIPGLLNKMSSQGHRLLPRSALRRIAAALKF